MQNSRLPHILKKRGTHRASVPNFWPEYLEKGVFTFVRCKYRTDKHSAKAFYVNKPCISRHLINWRSVSVHIIKVSEISRIILECWKLVIKAT